LWSFQTGKRPQLPSGKKPKLGSESDDLFILAKLDAEKLTPSPEADRRTLIAAISFDLNRLAATSEESRICGPIPARRPMKPG